MAASVWVLRLGGPGSSLMSPAAFTAPFVFNGLFSLSQMATLEQEGEEVVGQARCPFESRQSNVGLFAGERVGYGER